MTLRPLPSLLLVSACLLATTAFAQAPAPAADGPAAEPAQAEAFVTHSHVIVPRRVGDYVLEGTSYDPQRRAAGVGARYVLAAHPETRLDLFIYPAGEMPAAQALDRGMADFRASFQFGIDNGYYTELRIVEDTGFDLPAEVGGPVDLDNEPAALREALRSLQPQPLPGRLLVLALTHQPSGMPMHSRGYLFYKQLFFFKGRISAARSRIDGDRFAALSDDAMHALVPAIEVLNIGRCAQIELAIDEDEADEEKRAATAAESLVYALARFERNNCARDDETLAERARDAEVVTLRFEPGEWR